MNVDKRLNSVLEYVRDINNPYIRLVNSAMNKDGRAVPFYQMEEVREATFQSDYACEMIIKTLVPRLNDTSAIVVNKALTILRVLFIEGATGIRIRMVNARSSLHRIAHPQDIHRDTLEKQNKEIALSLLEALDGNSQSLVTLSTSHTSTRKDAESTPQHSYRSDFQIMHEKEKRSYRKQCEKQQQQQSAVIVRERVYGAFDGNLPPDKLVEQVIMSPKKRFAQQELDSFVSAAISTGQVPKVCAALDQHLHTGRQTLQNRYKVLLIVEGLVNSGVEEAREYFRDNKTGICRHLEVNSADNPVKAEASQCIARRIMEALQTPEVTSLMPMTTSLPRQSGASPQPAMSQVDSLFSDLQVKEEPSFFASPDLFLSKNPPSSVIVEDIFASPHFSQSVPLLSQSPSNDITALPSVSPPPQLFDWKQQQQQIEEAQGKMQPMSSVLAASGNPVGSSYSAPNRGLWGQQKQQRQENEQQTQREDWYLSESMFKDCTASGTSNVVPSQPSALDSPGTVEGLFAVGGSHESRPTLSSVPQNDADKLKLMQQILAQMETTRSMLEQQQSAFLALQAELQKK